MRSALALTLLGLAAWLLSSGGVAQVGQQVAAGSHALEVRCTAGTAGARRLPAPELAALLSSLRAREVIGELCDHAFADAAIGCVTGFDGGSVNFAAVDRTTGNDCRVQTRVASQGATTLYSVMYFSGEDYVIGAAVRLARDAQWAPLCSQLAYYTTGYDCSAGSGSGAMLEGCFTSSGMIDALPPRLRGALCGQGFDPRDPLPRLALPETPSRDDVVAALGAVAPAVEACPGAGAVTVEITVAGASGLVVSAVAPRDLDPAVASCVQQAVLGASFPPFSRSTFRVSYPFHY